MAPVLRLACSADLPALARIYGAGARQLGPAVYGPEQVAAWAGFADDAAGFARYVLDAETWVACADDGAPIGFAGLGGHGEVHSLYVRPELARRGLGTALLARLLERAQAQGIERLAAWVTPLSRPLFERAGFVLVETVRAPFQGVLFERYRVQRG